MNDEISSNQNNPIEIFVSGISVFNDAVTCNNKGVVYEHKIQVQNKKSGAVSYITEYNLYCMKLSKHGTSNANYQIAVVTPGYVILPVGEIELYLMPGIELLKEKSPLSSPLCNEKTFRIVLEKNFGIESTEVQGKERLILSTEEMWINFFHSERIFEIITPIPLDELKNVKNIDNVIELALTDGLTKSSGLLTFMKGQIPKPNPNILSPDEYMPYAPNGIIVTNTKTGKTTTAHRISKNVVNRPTAANLLGFSTASEIHVGRLDGQVETCFVDEFTENLEENVSDGLLTYMERGTTKTARGHGVTTNGYTPIVFMGNPKIEGVSYYDLLDYFRNNINQITCNPQALGSRLGFLIFDNDMDKAHGIPFDREISKKSLLVLKTLQEAFKNQFSELFRNREIQEWLNTPFEDGYIKLLIDAADKASLIEVKEFMRGEKDAYKHIRGTALHIAFVEFYEVLLTKGNLNIKEFLEECNLCYEDLLTHWMQTLNRIVSVKLDNSIYVRILEFAPDYIKLFIKTTFLCDWENNMLPLESFGDKYVGMASDRGKYINFGNLKNNLLKNKTKTNEILKTYGLKFTDFNGTDLVGLESKELYLNFKTAFKEFEGSGSSK